MFYLPERQVKKLLPEIFSSRVKTFQLLPRVNKTYISLTASDIMILSYTNRAIVTKRN